MEKFTLAREPFVVEATTVLAPHWRRRGGLHISSEGLTMVGIILVLAASYLIGSLPPASSSGVCSSERTHETSVGNAGGTNAWRVFGWRGGLPR